MESFLEGCPPDDFHIADAQGVFQCIFCGDFFSERSALDAHLPSHVTPGDSSAREKALKCPVCNYEVWSEDDFESHLKSHVLGYKCIFCDFTTVKRSKLRSHLPEHAFERNFKCDLCGLGFCKKDLLKRHLKTHGPKTLACTQCEYRTFGKRILREHIATKHEVKNLYKCKECSSEFKHSGDLGIHKRKVHKAQWSKFGRSDMKRCPDCPFETKRKYEYVFHRLERHENFPIIQEDPMIKCGFEECSFQADDELKFVNHVQSKHNPDGMCRLCDKSGCEHLKTKYYRTKPKKEQRVPGPATLLENVQKL
ncbi:RE1-silencing transcription factor B [Galendromus occidentalis]|uniref:RE1-silencing transcription factor B n=1 Tax=Galendromus occidentalis TaxID=34638 RepID=A0AAJ6QQR3_9ACAR|nr:RE1-silencing transcription factor B [Galendromus occidentalis]